MVNDRGQFMKITAQHWPKKILLWLTAAVLTLGGLFFWMRQDQTYPELPQEEIARLASPAICMLAIHWDDGRFAIGMGFVASAQGRIAVSRHSVAEAKRVFAVCNAHFAPVEGIHKHPDQDLALLNTTIAGVAPLPLSRRDPEKLTGKKIYVVRSRDHIHAPVVAGQILGFDDRQQKLALLMYKPLYGGNSGAPVLLGNGEVIGVISNVWTIPGKPSIYFAAPVRDFYGIPDHALPP